MKANLLTPEGHLVVDLGACIGGPPERFFLPVVAVPRVEFRPPMQVVREMRRALYVWTASGLDRTPVYQFEGYG